MKNQIRSSYVSKNGRHFNIVSIPSAIYVFVPITETEECGVFVLPWYFPSEQVISMIEYWDTECYDKVDWDKVRADLNFDKEDLS